MDYWRITFTGEVGESADVSVKLNGNEVHPNTDVSLPWNVIILNNPTGTVDAHAARNDEGPTGELKVQILANGVLLASGSDAGPIAVVDVTATR